MEVKIYLDGDEVDVGRLDVELASDSTEDEDIKMKMSEFISKAMYFYVENIALKKYIESKESEEDDKPRIIV